MHRRENWFSGRSGSLLPKSCAQPRTSRLELVEAAGVEPASENVTGQETTCLFRFMPQALGALRRFPRDVRGCALRTDKKR